MDFTGFCNGTIGRVPIEGVAVLNALTLNCKSVPTAVDVAAVLGFPMLSLGQAVVRSDGIRDEYCGRSRVGCDSWSSDDLDASRFVYGIAAEILDRARNMGADRAAVANADYTISTDEKKY